MKHRNKDVTTVEFFYHLFCKRCGKDYWNLNQFVSCPYCCSKYSHSVIGVQLMAHKITYNELVRRQEAMRIPDNCAECGFKKMRITSLGVFYDCMCGKGTVLMDSRLASDSAPNYEDKRHPECPLPKILNGGNNK